MNGSMFIGTWWALVPPLLAILLAFVTKEVYSSLFIGSQSVSFCTPASIRGMRSQASLKFYGTA